MPPGPYAGAGPVAADPGPAGGAALPAGATVLPAQTTPAPSLPGKHAYADRRNGTRWPRKPDHGSQPDGFRLIGSVETDPPVLTRAGVTPTSLDLRTSGSSVAVTVAAADATSGVGVMDARLVSPKNTAYSASVPLRLVAGTARHGRWAGTIPMPRCTSPGGRWTLWVNAYDRAGNAGKSVRGLTVDVAALDHIRPTAEVEGPVSVSAPVTFTFSKDVTNVDPANALIQKVVRDQVTGVVAGTWACQDAGATPVDCATGPLRIASFTPTDPWATAADYAADLAPNGTAGVRDLAGNPVEGPSTGYFHPPDST